MKHRLLLVDDEALQRGALAGWLRKQGYETREAGGADEALALAAVEPFDAVLTDRRMPGRSGLELLAELRSRNPEVPVLVITAYGSVEDAVEAMRAGAFGYVAKPVDLDALALQLERALEHRQLLGENRRLRERLERYDDPSPVAESPAMRAVLGRLARVAPTEATVLVTGESGSGKELVARALHRASARADGPFVAVNVAAIPEALLESELFGHEKGAFTGASARRIGRFERAQSGTLFIDEVGDMPAAAQIKLLRVLQERVVERVGGGEAIEVDLRLVAATNRPLERLVREGRFREDLFYRLNVVRLELPALRERREDLPALARRLLADSCERLGRETPALHPRTLDRLMAHEWPGNVRELGNVMERAAILARQDPILPEDLGLDAPPPRPDRAADWLEREDLSLPQRLEGAERALLLAQIDACGGNRSEAARRLGLSEKNVRDRLRRWSAGGAGPGIAEDGRER